MAVLKRVGPEMVALCQTITPPRYGHSLTIASAERRFRSRKREPVAGPRSAKRRGDRFVRPLPGDDRSGRYYDQDGISTVSITWITPFD